MEIATTFKLKQAFSTVLSNFRIIYLQRTQIYWAGSLHLEDFIENLSSLKDENLHTYLFLTGEYKNVINEAKKLIARLKLQGLPIPSTSLDHNGYFSSPEKNTTSHTIIVDSQSSWKYFFDLYEVPHWARNAVNSPNVVAEEERYLGMVSPVVTEVCEAITRAIYHCLSDVHGKTIT